MKAAATAGGIPVGGIAAAPAAPQSAADAPAPATAAAPWLIAGAAPAIAQNIERPTGSRPRFGRGAPLSAVNRTANILGGTENHTALIHCNLYQIALAGRTPDFSFVFGAMAYIPAETTEPDSSTYATRSFNCNSARDRRSAGRAGLH